MQEKQSGQTPPEASGQSNNLFVVTVNKKYGFIDRTGKIMIQPQFDYAKDFVDGRAVVAVYNPDFKMDYIDETGKIAVSQQFNQTRDFSEGLGAVGIGFFELHGGGDHHWGFVDRTGQSVIEAVFRESRNFSEGLAAVMNDDGKWGFIDKTGKVVIQFQFEDAFSFSEGLACVLTEGLFGFIDKSGRIVIAPRFIVPGQFKEGLAAVNIGAKNAKPYKHYGSYVAPKGELIFIDKAGNTALKFDKKVLGIRDFSEGLAVVELKRREKDFYKGFIDKTGKIVFALPFWGWLNNFSEGLAVVEHNHKFGFIDQTGKIVIKPEYSDAGDFRDGLARVETGKQLRELKGTERFGYSPKSGYIDKTGKVIWQPTN